MPKRIAFILKDNCVACGACTKVCPKSALSVFHGCYALIDTAVCIGCGKCTKECPANAIEVREREAAS